MSDEVEISELEALLTEINKADTSMLRIVFNTITARPDHWLENKRSLRYLIKYMREHG